MPLSRRTDPDTSRAAAVSMVKTAASHCALIETALDRMGPMGRFEIAEATGLDPVAVARRLADLVQAGRARRLVATFERTPSGRRGSVWRVLCRP
jgi:predicted ArsR family transcriptional regulator